MSAPRENPWNRVAHGIIAILSVILISMIVTNGPQLLDRVRDLAPTSTPRVTAAPTATAPANDLQAWSDYYVAKHTPKDVNVSNVLCIRWNDTTDNITIIADMDVMHSNDDYVKSAANLIRGFLSSISDRNDVNRVTMLFTGPFIDAYGNDVSDTGVRVEYSIDTIRKINYDYFYQKRHSDPAGIIKVADVYYIHPAYLD